MLPGLLLAVSLILALAAGVAPAPAEARDLLLLQSEIRRGELLSCDSSACRLDGSTIPRRDIVWIGLGDPPLPPPAVRNPLADELPGRVCAVGPPREPRWPPRGDATVRERLREVVSDPAGGNRTEGSGTSHIDGRTSDGLLVLGGASRPSSYQFNVGTAEYRYPLTTLWSSGPPTHHQELFTGIWVGKDPDPEQPRILDASGRMMKGEYTVTHEYGARTSLTESVSWELTRVSAPCDAPPPLPAESEPSDAAEP